MKAAVIYISLTGNTQAMAEAIYEGAVSTAGNEQVALLSVDTITAAEALTYDILILGSPAMGNEVLEEDSFEPFFSELEKNLTGKKIALFGSYGWGDGQWMRDWETRCNNAGAILITDSLIINEAPDTAALELCREFGKKTVK